VFRRWWLPAFAFKAVVIGGGYATGRELVEYFLPGGPRGGLAGMALAATMWSVVCALTFLLAFRTNSYDYRTFFRNLLGRLWIAFDAAYVVSAVVVLSVFGAAAGAIGASVWGWPHSFGTVGLLWAVVLVTAWGNDAVERLFKYVTVVLYVVYASFLAFGISHFGDRIAYNLAAGVSGRWAVNGITYAAYNIIAAVVILPVLRHLTSAKDAIIAGVLCGPVAIIPGVAFFLCALAFYPQIAPQALPSDFLLERMHMPVFRVVFQTTIFAALLESAAGTVHAVNERLGAVLRERGRSLSMAARALLSSGLMVVSVFLAARFGLVALVAKGYRVLASLLLCIYVVPVAWASLKWLRERCGP
jgi:uncharacterized membrane protein YkvI